MMNVYCTELIYKLKEECQPIHATIFNYSCEDFRDVLEVRDLLEIRLVEQQLYRQVPFWH